MNTISKTNRGTIMTRLAAVVAIGCLARLGVAPIQAQPADTGSLTRKDYAYYKLVTERNIFDPDRGPGGSRLGSRGQGGTRPARVDSISLLGTMTNEKGVYAFFGGSSSQYQKAVALGDEIAGFKLSNISFDGVTLKGPTNEMALTFSGSLRREEEGQWMVSDRIEPMESSGGNGSSESYGSRDNGGRQRGGSRDFSFRDFGSRDSGSRDFGSRRSRYGENNGNGGSGNSQSSSSSSSFSSSSRESTPSLGGTAADILRRLMERRQQETGEKKPDSEEVRDPDADIQGAEPKSNSTPQTESKP